MRRSPSGWAPPRAVMSASIRGRSASRVSLSSRAERRALRMSRKCLETTPGRLSLESFLGGHASEGLTLEVGAEDSTCGRWFPNRVAINIRPNEHVHVLADAYRLPFGDATFDVVLCAEVLEHTHTPALALREMQRVLKDGGKLL